MMRPDVWVPLRFSATEARWRRRGRPAAAKLLKRCDRVRGVARVPGSSDFCARSWPWKSDCRSSCLLGAGLVLRGFERLVGQDPGFDPEPLLAFTVSVPPGRYGDRSAADACLAPVLEAVRGVEQRTQLPLTDTRTATASYFSTLGLQLLRGRLMDERDTEAAPFVVVVNHFVLLGQEQQSCARFIAERLQPVEDGGRIISIHPH
jgi:hypothetical protein